MSQMNNVNTQGVMMNNQQFTNANALALRLDMRDEVANFQKFILGLETVYIQDPETGETVQQTVQSGERVVNDLGFQSLMAWISFVLNKHTVMGNFIDEDWYGFFMKDLHMDVWQDLVINRVKYGIDTRQLQSLHSKFMMCTRLVLTRPIFDKERQGMNSTTRIEERSATVPLKQGFFSGLPFMGKK